jgi:BRCA1/BRCA2-containing complex subunit 3
MTCEDEESMGLLFGNWTTDSGGCHSQVCIRSGKALMRSDRRKDRVEVSPDQLSEASNEAEQTTRNTSIQTRVVGWYHSHPHITVFPSHVDVRTQAQYQMLDEGFVGLIFSCFSNNKTNCVGKLQVNSWGSFLQLK